MAQGRRDDITLHLETLEQFFAVPEPDPFVHHARVDPGMDTLIDELRPKALIRKVRTTIVLPPDQLKPEAETQLREALTQYCHRHIFKEEA